MSEYEDRTGTWSGSYTEEASEKNPIMPVGSAGFGVFSITGGKQSIGCFKIRKI